MFFIRLKYSFYYLKGRLTKAIPTFARFKDPTSFVPSPHISVVSPLSFSR